jgi:glycosyltransferase involved in cell wall biosynthesis
VHLANSLQISKKIKINAILPESYILFVGHRHLYKNFNRFICAVAKLMKNDNKLHVICAGGNNFEDKEISMFRELDIENRVIQFNMNDDLLSSLYDNALLFVFPSLYEGFGIPLLESFSCGCPVACSNTSSFPEIAMDGAVYFDPKDEESIYECISEVLFDDNLKKQLVKNAYRRLESFSWEKTAKKTKEIYDEVMR